MNISDSDEILILKQLIEDFIQERLNTKIEKLDKNDEKRTKLIEEYKPINWIDSAARRVGQIQLVTHGQKYTNPYAKGSSIYFSPAAMSEKNIVSTKSLSSRQNDVVGNAAALDVLKFLQIDLSGEALLSRILRNDEELYQAFPGTEEQKNKWFAAFSNITQPKGKACTDSLSKQIYFPLDDGKYHLLSPLFPTSLVQEVHNQVQKRFSDEMKVAKKAKRENKPFAKGYKEFTNLAVQKFGGSNKQNISQLNTERGGKAYLLASLPPEWKTQGLKPPLKVESIFPKIFARRYRVRDYTKKLRQFLDKTDRNNKDIRLQRECYVAAICDELIMFSSEICRLEGGWSAHPDCKLTLAETCWLDPQRVATDEVFRQQRDNLDWQKEVSNTFAHWLNGKLQTDKLRFGDDEHREWQHVLGKELSLINWEMFI